MTCPACTEAERNPWTCGSVRHDCLSCQAREIAKGPDAKARDRDPGLMADAMRQAWPDVVEYKRGRLEVWRWLKAIEVDKQRSQAA